MDDDRRRLLPPLGALATFVAAARSGSFSKAGAQLGLTQSAVSRQIALLEDWLQLSLFDRKGRRVTLNPDGAHYAEAIRAALDIIRSATATALLRKPETELNIATLPSFGMRWLAPRLPRLTLLHPDIVVNFAARSDMFSFADEHFDAAVHFGHPDWLDCQHDLLFKEEAIPVCSPDRLANQPITTPADVLSWPLLVQTSRRDSWATWLRLARVNGPTPLPSGSFEHFLMVAQAAAAGGGIALIPRFLIEPELEAGSLVCPLEIPLTSDEAYYLVRPKERNASTALQHFRTWILNEIARDSHQTGGTKREPEPDRR